MKDQRLKQILEGKFDDSNEYSLRAMLADFYTMKMASSIILIWSYGVIMAIVTVYCAINFFKTTEIRDLIMYATGFICGLGQITAIKIFAWQMIHRNNLKREFKKLELTIAEALSEKQ